MQIDRDTRWRARLQAASVMALCGAVILALEAQGPPGAAPQTVPAAQPQEAAKPGELGYTDTPLIPGQKWRVHDVERPQPPLVTPGPAPGAPPSDAIVLFDGKDLSKWAQRTKEGALVDPQWPVRDGYFETGAKTGSLFTRDSFGDVQLHVEWAAPPEVSGRSQGRGNSGVILMGRYEVQVLDMYNNRTYADGGAASLYGQWPPLVSAPRSPGEWQTYDIVFEAPRFEGETLVRPAYATVFWNGVLAHHRQELLGPTLHRQATKYVPHEAELPLTLQDHSNPVRYRNVWVRRLEVENRGSGIGDR